jgi:hypothetical protein
MVAFITGESLLFPNALLDYMWRFNPEGAAVFHSIGGFQGYSCSRWARGRSLLRLDYYADAPGPGGLPSFSSRSIPAAIS